MPTTRHNQSFNHVEEWTEEINEIDNQSGYINARGWFDVRSTSQTSILFDRVENDIVLLPDADRAARKGSFGKDRTVSTTALPLAYFDHSDNITPEDIQGQRRPGSADEGEALQRVITEKLEDLRMAVDETHEYMKIQAIKGITTTPEGTVLANMFTETGTTLKTVDFLLGTSTTNIDAKIDEVLNHIGQNRKGSAVQAVEVLCDRDFFNKLIDHPKVRETYMSSTSNSEYQRQIAEFMQWGIMNTFTHRGVTFRSYNHTFSKPDGTTENAFDANEGYAVAIGRGLWRGYVGPSNKLSGANQPGAPMFAFEYRDPRDEFHELQVQSSPLMFCTKPGVIVKLTSSN